MIDCGVPHLYVQDTQVQLLTALWLKVIYILAVSQTENLILVKLQSVSQCFSQPARQSDISPVLFSSFVHRGHPYLPVTFWSPVVSQRLILQEKKEKDGLRSDRNQAFPKYCEVEISFSSLGGLPGFRWISDTDLFLATSRCPS